MHTTETNNLTFLIFSPHFHSFCHVCTVSFLKVSRVADLLQIFSVIASLKYFSHVSYSICSHSLKNSCNLIKNTTKHSIKYKYINIHLPFVIIMIIIKEYFSTMWTNKKRSNPYLPFKTSDLVGFIYGLNKCTFML